VIWANFKKKKKKIRLQLKFEVSNTWSLIFS